MAATGSRFASLVKNGTEEARRKSRVPQNTKNITDWGIRVWSDWSASRRVSESDDASRAAVTTPLLDMQVEDFAYWLGKFVLEARKSDGSEYPPKTIYSLVCCFRRYFEANSWLTVSLTSTCLTSLTIILGIFAKLWMLK